MVCLPSEEECMWVLIDGPCMIARSYLFMQCLKHEFDHFKEHIRRMAMWVRLSYLPFEYYQIDLLWKMGNLMGKL